MLLKTVPRDDLDFGDDSQLPKEHVELLLLLDGVVGLGVDAEKDAEGGLALPAVHHVEDAGQLEQEEAGVVEEAAGFGTEQIHGPHVDERRFARVEDVVLVQLREVPEQGDVFAHF